MPSRKDQLHSYQFMMQRVTSSVMVHETDPEQTPLRRGVGAVVGGVMIAALVAVIFGIVGVLTNVGGTSWKADGAVIIERETGATYVYQDEMLQPTLNYASARLISGNQDAETHRVAGSSLQEVPRRPTVGIPGAPTSLPESEYATTGPWTMCSVPGEDVAGAPTTNTTLLIGENPTGGTRLGERAVLVRDSETGDPYLIWRSHRYPIGGEPASTIRSLYGANRTPVEVGTAWLNGLPTGQEIGPIAVENLGQPSSAVPEHRIGDVVFHPVSGGEQHYLVRDDGLAPATELQVRILEGQYSVTPQRIAPLLANEAPTKDVLAPPPGQAAPPQQTPPLAAQSADGPPPLCSVAADAATAPSILIDSDVSTLEDGIETTQESGSGTRLADRVLVPAGRVAVVQAMPSSSAETGAYNIVTDLGLRFPVPNEELLASLGYEPNSAVQLPASLVQRIPAGPTLDPAAARQPAPISGPDGR
ncbi:type VII secretion protein EccB [Tamaricihabitans halophyticus]|uniref:Type VII secretion protein EccB n=1 Tax=Tamaricihabitans halophyticus TaxID=1262583 RepID=A0A4R2QUD3_9PSEU|nr:type VII secretion protein EccB [Tamaricihabitans halophyticus]TCP53592.1 type VII secretion protein EccB [Tamaricihabitans halophyticus]